MLWFQGDNIRETATYAVYKITMNGHLQMDKALLLFMLKMLILCQPTRIQCILWVMPQPTVGLLQEMLLMLLCTNVPVVLLLKVYTGKFATSKQVLDSRFLMRVGVRLILVLDQSGEFDP